MPRSLEELIARWKQVATHAAAYDLTLDDWLNDLDLRALIERQLSIASAPLTAELSSGLAAADAEFRRGTRESARSLWGEAGERDHDREMHWWYFRYPSAPGPEMHADLRAAGIIPRGSAH